MLNLRKVAITGGISSGKTTLCRLLEKHGAYCVYSDEIIHQLLSQDSSCIQKVVQLLGEKILNKGKIDRKKVASEVFTDPEKLNALEEIMHPLLLREVEKQYQKLLQENRYSLFLVEIPLIQEIRKEDQFDLIIAVYVDEEIAKRRYKKRGFSEEEYERRMQRQWNVKEKAEKADIIIENNGTKTEFKQKALKLISNLSHYK
ncbi:MAG: dephospho-CoA kinase [Simkania negevensis]|nr:dephospho-CoA kinase [Simkania negevensis]